MPELIQAGMGAHVSCARLANVTSRLGALGVVSSVGLRHIVPQQVRDGHADTIALARTFPVARYVEELLSYAPGGKRHTRAIPIDVPDAVKGGLARRLSAISAYVEVMRAKNGHRGLVGINVMWKCALTVLPSIYGALLAGVDAFLCGAGVPMELHEIVARMRRGTDLDYAPLTGTGTHVQMSIADDATADLLQSRAMPKLLPILSNFAFCKRLLDTWAKRSAEARPDAFVLENHAAGGHNAQPRDKVAFGEADDINSYFDKVLELGVPVYVAGAFADGGSRRDLLYWQQRGAIGIQVGSRFALTEESGLREDLKQRAIEMSRQGTLKVLTDARLSPTGFPFKYVPMEGTYGDLSLRAQQKRGCDLGYLLQSRTITQPDGTEREVYLCPAMPEEQYIALGGAEADTVDRLCLCNALLSTAGFSKVDRPALVTLGESAVATTESLTARQVVEDILTPEAVAANERRLADAP
jgi:NAD(P)H-dependent flavin oxidoreductase YrpB (nitropropane dioxygenase family)